MTRPQIDEDAMWRPKVDRLTGEDAERAIALYKATHTAAVRRAALLEAAEMAEARWATYEAEAQSCGDHGDLAHERAHRGAANACAALAVALRARAEGDTL